MRILKENMGYPYCVFFPRARDAILAYAKIDGRPVGLPTNICKELADHLGDRVIFGDIDNATGLADVAVNLYGFRRGVKQGEESNGLEIDPLMTGWRAPQCKSTIISFGRKKFISLGYGGAFLTESKSLAKEMAARQWPCIGCESKDWYKDLEQQLYGFDPARERGFENIAKWDQALGDLLIRIPLEQKIPWRVMRRASWSIRQGIVSRLRAAGLYVSTNYPPITGSNEWGDTVLGFMPDHDPEPTVEIIKRVING